MAMTVPLPPQGDTSWYDWATEIHSDVDAQGTKLDGIEAGADVTDAANVAAAGAVMDTGNETIAGVKTFTSPPLVPGPTTEFEASTKGYVDTTAVLDSEVTSLSGIKTLTVPDSTTISAFTKTLLDDADAAAARTTLGVPAAADVASTVVLTQAEYDALTPDADTIYYIVAGATVAPTITTTTLDTITQGVAFSQTLAATGTAPITWAVSAGTLPAGMSLSTGGVLFGEAESSGAYSFTVQATNAAGSDTQAYSGTVEVPVETTWTTDFPGTALPSGWTYEGAVGSVAVAGSRATINAPDGTSRDSIFSTGSSDASLGIKKAVTLHTGDLDIAVQVDTDLSNKMGLGLNLLVFGATDADAVRFGSYAPANDTDNEYGKYFIYTRSGGSGATVSNLTWGGSNVPGVASPGWMSGGPSWLRVAYASGTGIWTFYASADGVTWRTLATATRSFTPVTFKAGVTTTDTDGGTWDVRINKVIDVIEFGSTDLRDAVATYTRTPIAVIDPTSDVSLPAGWVDDSNGSATVAMVGGGTPTGVLRFGDQQSDTATNAPTRGGAASARIRYSASSASNNAGLLVRLEADNGLVSSYIVPGLTSYDGVNGWIDQYASGTGYALEVNASNTIRRPIRITDPLDGNVAPAAAFSTGLDESPYFHMEQITAAAGISAGPRWVRIEVVGRRVRYREWADGDTEPSTWGYFDGQDQTFQDGGITLAPAVALAHNSAGAAEVCTVDLSYCEFYTLEPA